MIGIGLRYYARLSEALFEDLAEATRSPTLKVGMCPLRLSGLSYGTDRGPNREWNRILIHFSPEGLSPELLFFSPSPTKKSEHTCATKKLQNGPIERDEFCELVES